MNPLEPDDLYRPAAGPFPIERARNVELPTTGERRVLPLRITWPVRDEPSPVILFSHGATGSKDGYTPLTEYWAAHGYVCIQPTHGDSLALLTREQKKEFPNLVDRVRDQSTLRHWRTRPADIRTILDALPQLPELVPALQGKLDADTLGMGGHSFGAQTAQMVAGVEPRGLAGRRISLRDDRPQAFLWISPQGNEGRVDDDSWSRCTRPTLIVTGQEDSSPRNGRPYTWRLEAFRNLPPGDKHLLLIEGAHHGFGGISGALRYPGSGPAIPEHVAMVQAGALAFWDAYLKRRGAALDWLQENRIAAATDKQAEISRR